MSDNLETKLEIIQISDVISIHFLYIPEGYTFKKITMDNHKTKLIGKLKQFNRLKLLSNWKEANGDLVKLFTEALEKKGWDFKKFPNPTAYACEYIS